MGDPYLPACSLNQFAEIGVRVYRFWRPDGVQLRTAHDCSEYLRMGMCVSSERVSLEQVGSALPSQPLISVRTGKGLHQDKPVCGRHRWWTAWSR